MTLFYVCSRRYTPHLATKQVTCLFILGSGCVKSVGHQGPLATSGLYQVVGVAEEKLVHCGSCVKG